MTTAAAAAGTLAAAGAGVVLAAEPVAVEPDPALEVGVDVVSGVRLARPDLPTLRVGAVVVAVESGVVDRSVLRRAVPPWAGAEVPADDPAESVVSAWATAGPAANAAPTATVATPAPSQA
ncbi:hypothetical protein [Mycobacterium sp. M26]|uniref:hypothetical protein n=1 Tax=Mycobacterium sp. M26 TaxID=1762962 RepID=UPI00073E5800|nr:hypothetical protein [Mycobacterium sp. M26]